jgi:hypothetical protein
MSHLFRADNKCILDCIDLKYTILKQVGPYLKKYHAAFVTAITRLIFIEIYNTDIKRSRTTTFSKHITHYGPEVGCLYNNLRAAPFSYREVTPIHNLAIGERGTALDNGSWDWSTITKVHEIVIAQM